MRLAHELAVITIAASSLYLVMGDSSNSELKSIAKLVKEHKGTTTKPLQTLCKT